jgi:uncharacterized membrane protein
VEDKLALAVHLSGATLVGVLFLLYPRIARPGLLFGVYVGEQTWQGDEARCLQAAYRRRASAGLVVGIAAGLILSAAAGWHPAWMPAVTLLPIVGCLWAYLWAHRRARRLAAVGTPEVIGPFEPDRPSGRALAVATLALCAAAGAAVVLWAWARYPDLPDRIPTHFGITGAPDAWRPKSPASAMVLPVLTLVVGVGLSGLAWAVAGARRALRAGDQGVSLRAQMVFRRAMSRYLSGVALTTVSMLACLSVGSVQVGLGQARALPAAGLILVGALLLHVLAGALYLSLRYGQGGARLERSAAQAPLTDGLADNRRWVLGVFYVNREDPSWLVEARFGFGYTVNLGNPWALAAVVGFLTVVVGLPLAVLVWG